MEMQQRAWESEKMDGVPTWCFIAQTWPGVCPLLEVFLCGFSHHVCWAPLSLSFNLPGEHYAVNAL